MTPEICLISVPHSGTMFVREIFVSQGWHEQGLNGQPNPTPTLYQGHCEKEGQAWQALCLNTRMPIVMPLRHPYRVEESWRRRGEEPQRMLMAYHHMLKLLLPCVKVWLPVDGSTAVRREAQRRLGVMAGKELKIDWDTVVNGEKNTHTVALSSLDPSERVREIRLHSLFQEFYGDDGQSDLCGTPSAEQQAEQSSHHSRR